jgi:hypothetical protein
MAALTYLFSPRMTANNAPSPFVASASSAWSSGPAFRAFDMVIQDGVRDFGWLSAFGNTTGSVQVDLGVATTIIGYVVMESPYIGSATSPKDWTLQGSADGSNWTTLDTQSGKTWNVNYTQQLAFAISSATYRYYKLNITLNNGNASFVGVGQLTFIIPTPSAGGIIPANMNGGFV